MAIVVSVIGLVSMPKGKSGQSKETLEEALANVNDLVARGDAGGVRKYLGRLGSGMQQIPATGVERAVGFLASRGLLKDASVRKEVEDVLVNGPPEAVTGAAQALAGAKNSADAPGVLHAALHNLSMTPEGARALFRGAGLRLYEQPEVLREALAPWILAKDPERKRIFFECLAQAPTDRAVEILKDRQYLEEFWRYFETSTRKEEWAIKAMAAALQALPYRELGAKFDRINALLISPDAAVSSAAAQQLGRALATGNEDIRTEFMKRHREGQYPLALYDQLASAAEASPEGAGSVRWVRTRKAEREIAARVQSSGRPNYSFPLGEVAFCGSQRAHIIVANGTEQVITFLWSGPMVGEKEIAPGTAITLDALPGEITTAVLTRGHVLAPYCDMGRNVKAGFIYELFLVEGPGAKLIDTSDFRFQAILKDAVGGSNTGRIANLQRVLSALESVKLEVSRLRK